MDFAGRLQGPQHRAGDQRVEFKYSNPFSKILSLKPSHRSQRWIFDSTVRWLGIVLAFGVANQVEQHVPKPQQVSPSLAQPLCSQDYHHARTTHSTWII